MKNEIWMETFLYYGCVITECSFKFLKICVCHLEYNMSCTEEEAAQWHWNYWTKRSIHNSFNHVQLLLKIFIVQCPLNPFIFRLKAQNCQIVNPQGLIENTVMAHLPIAAGQQWHNLQFSLQTSRERSSVEVKKTKSNSSTVIPKPYNYDQCFQN